MQILDIIAVPLGVCLVVYLQVRHQLLCLDLSIYPAGPAAVVSRVAEIAKSQADRARLAPRLERLQKKYQKDPQKLQQKQTELYEKEGVKITAGCLPMVIR